MVNDTVHEDMLANVFESNNKDKRDSANESKTTIEGETSKMDAHMERNTNQLGEEQNEITNINAFVIEAIDSNTNSLDKGGINDQQYVTNSPIERATNTQPQKDEAKKDSQEVTINDQSTNKKDTVENECTTLSNENDQERKAVKSNKIPEFIEISALKEEGRATFDPKTQNTSNSNTTEQVDSPKNNDEKLATEDTSKEDADGKVEGETITGENVSNVDVGKYESS